MCIRGKIGKFQDEEKLSLAVSNNLALMSLIAPCDDNQKVGICADDPLYVIKIKKLFRLVRKPHES